MVSVRALNFGFVAAPSAIAAPVVPVSFRKVRLDIGEFHTAVAMLFSSPCFFISVLPPYRNIV
jgi:hypothetical protein